MTQVLHHLRAYSYSYVVADDILTLLYSYGTGTVLVPSYGNRIRTNARYGISSLFGRAAAVAVVRSNHLTHDEGSVETIRRETLVTRDRTTKLSQRQKIIVVGSIWSAIQAIASRKVTEHRRFWHPLFRHHAPGSRSSGSIAVGKPFVPSQSFVFQKSAAIAISLHILYGYIPHLSAFQRYSLEQCLFVASLHVASSPSVKAAL